jgi:hypothetical protein
MQTITSASHVIAALAQYAQILDAASFDAAIDVYTAWGKTVDSQDRLLLCQAMNDAIISRQGQGFEALLPFILVDPDPQVVANAALKTAVLFPARHRDPLEGARFVARLTRIREHPRRCGAILGGLMLLGDERLTPLIHDTWDCLPPESRIEAASRRSPFVFRAHVLLLIDLLEEEPDDCVRSAIADTLGKLASRAQKVGVIDAERVIPGWKADGNPFVVREHFSRGEFASEIVDRLDYLCVTEAVTEKAMPLACLLWKGLGE